MTVFVRATPNRNTVGIVGVYQHRGEVDKGTFELYACQRGEEQTEKGHRQ